MSIPAGYTQLTSGLWTKTSDGSGPYAWSGIAFYLISSGIAGSGVAADYTQHPSGYWFKTADNSGPYAYSSGGVFYLAGNAPNTYTAATLPAASSVSAGTLAYVSNWGAKGTLAMSDGSSRWRPVNGRTMLAKMTVAISGINNTAQRVLRAQIPAGMIAAGDDIELLFSLIKSGGTDTARLSAYYGPTGDNTDTAIIGYSAYQQVAAASRGGGIIGRIATISATSVQRTGNAASSGSAYGAISASASSLATTVPDMSAAATWVSVYVDSSGATDTITAPDIEITQVTP